MCFRYSNIVLNRRFSFKIKRKVMRSKVCVGLIRNVEQKNIILSFYIKN